MRFLVDAQLPPLLASWIIERGYDTLHTNDLPAREETEDNFIREIADRENRIVITKDSDFQDSYLLRKEPKKLLLITTGNLKNRQLLDVFRKNFGQLIDLFALYDFIELSNEEIIIHD